MDQTFNSNATSTPSDPPGPGNKTTHAPLVTPILDGSEPTPGKKQKLVRAFRWRLGRIGGTSDEKVREWLEAEGWCLEVAIEVFKKTTLLQARDAELKQLAGRSLKTQYHDKMLAAASYSRHQNHRRTIDVLYRMIESSQPTDQMTGMRLAYLLLESDFDEDRAFEAHLERRNNAGDLADADRAERRLCLRRPNNVEPNDVHKDTRLRDFMEIAGTDDVVSGKAFLKKHDWHMGNAIDIWMKSGFPRTQPTADDTIKRSGYRFPQEGHIENDDMWPAPRPLFAITVIDAADIADANTDYGTAPYNHVSEGARFINLDIEPAYIGIARPDKLEQHYVCKGKSTVLYVNVAVKEGGVDLDNSLINWNNTEHVSALNKAYNQNPCRRGGIRKRPDVVKYTPGEESWIYNWHHDRVQHYCTVNPQFVLATDQTWKDVVDFSCRDFHRDFNANFKGKTVADFKTPHPGREMQNLSVKRTRMPKLCADFGIKPLRTHVPTTDE